MKPRLLYLVTEDWYFLSHRLPMAAAARDAGFEVHVATRVSEGRERIEQHGFAVHPLSWQRGSVAPVANLRAVGELRGLLRRLEPDILHNVAMKPGVLGGLAATGRRDMAVLSSVAGLGSLFLNDTARGRVLRLGVGAMLRHLLNRRRARAIVQNQDDAQALKTLGVRPRNIVLIPGSGVDTDTLTPLPEPGGPVTAAFVGRMLEDKGLRALMTAHRILRDKGVDLTLLLAGNPDPENPTSISASELQAWSRQPGVRWLGHVGDINEVWARAHFAVLPSRREGMPKSLLEAAACGRAMVAADAPGCRDIARQGVTGLTHKIDDAEAIADAMERLASDPALRATFAANARRLALEEYSAKRVGEMVVALYKESV